MKDPARYVVSASPPGLRDGFLRLQGAGAPCLVSRWEEATWFSAPQARAWARLVAGGAMMQVAPSALP